MAESIFKTEVEDEIEKGMLGKAVQIPIHLDRVNDHLSIRKCIYTLLGGNTGSGKTSFVDDTYVLEPYLWWKNNKDSTDLKFRALYRSMERKRKLKLTKWACWKLYKDFGILVDSDTLLGYRKTKISTHIWQKVVECRDWADEMLDYVEIIDGRCTPNELGSWIKSYALKHGHLYEADAIGISYANLPNGGYFALFNENSYKTLKTGERILVISFPDPFGKVHEMKQFERVYVEKDENLFTSIVADHIGKMQPNAGMQSGKATIDATSAVLCDARDLYSHSPVAISQFNRGIGDIQRIKYAEGDLAPILEDFKESGNTQEDADLILALFNPYRYKSFDENGMYKGYDILNKTISPNGHNRYRSLTILKNSYGVDDVDFGLKFLGEVNRFSTLPQASADPLFGESTELVQAYAEIKAGL